MANGLQLNTSTVVTGLGTQTYTFSIAGLYTCAVNFTIPYKAIGQPGDSTSLIGASGLSIVVNLNGSPVLTLTSPSPTQPSMGGSVRVQAAVGDVLTVVLSSSAAADQLTNVIKGTVNLYQGE